MLFLLHHYNGLSRTKRANTGLPRVIEAFPNLAPYTNHHESLPSILNNFKQHLAMLASARILAAGAQTQRCTVPQQKSQSDVRRKGELNS